MTSRPARRRGAGTTTLADVADAAGVSEITVSRVVRAKGPFTEETRRRVEEAIRATGYVPNRLAGSLASAETGLFGIVVPSLANSVFPDVLRGITEAIALEGRRAVIAVTDYDADAEAGLVRSLIGWRPAGLVLPGLEHDQETRRMLVGGRLPVVEIMDVDGEPIDVAVGLSHAAAGAAMARHLLERGYRRFGFVGHDIARDLRAGKRLASFRHTVAEAGAGMIAEEIVEGPSSVPAGRAGLARLLGRAPDVEAVFFSNDDMAIGGYFHCLAADLAVPARLALAGFNGLDVAGALPQPLTTLVTRRYDIGLAAGRALVDRAAGRPVVRLTDLGFSIEPGATA